MKLSSQAIANGRAPSSEIKSEILALEMIPLDEGPGESYHRITQLAKDRASGSRVPALLASTREPQNLDVARRFTTQYGDLGRQVFRFEWVNYKRVLKPSTYRQYLPVLMKAKPFYEKLYFIDFVHDTWAGLIATSGGARPDRPNLDSNDKLKHEYLRHALTKR